MDVDLSPPEPDLLTLLSGDAFQRIRGWRSIEKDGHRPTGRHLLERVFLQDGCHLRGRAYEHVDPFAGTGLKPGLECRLDLPLRLCAAEDDIPLAM
jgi:hypothetical protein